MKLTLRTKIAAAVATGLLGSTVLAAWVVAAAAASAEIKSIDALLTGIANTYKYKGNGRSPYPAQDLNSVAIAIVSVSEGQRQVIAGTTGNVDVAIPSLSWDQANRLCAEPTTLQTRQGALRVGARCLSKEGAVVIAAKPLAEVEARLTRIRLLALASALSVSVIGYIVTALMIRRFFSPLSDLARSATLMGKGDLDASLPAFESNDELAQLSDAMAAMAVGLRTKIEDLEEGSARMRRLVSMTSHELRTPLTVIRGYAQLLTGPLRQDATRADEALNRIIDETGRIDRLIQRILDSQGEEGALGQKATHVAFTQMVRESLALVNLGKPQATINAALDEVRILGDADLLWQLCNNIAQNLERHAKPDATIAVRLHSSGSTVHLRVTDNGPGLSPARLKAIGDALRDGAPIPSETGMGLGMLIMQRAVKASGGTLAVYPNEQGGMTLDVELPVEGGPLSTR